ncbi:MAG: T9SS type A sorting domain-containing protein [Bacteroidetes bacterium]|nr:T9SS type A sorting domain-containing protein [Bacteroidota bacterium]
MLRTALFPSKGLLRNDMGAYGGPGASLSPITQTITGIQTNYFDKSICNYPNPFFSITTLQTGFLLNDVSLKIYNLYGQQVKHINNISGSNYIFNRENLKGGMYIIRLTKDNSVLATLKIVISDN